MNIFYGHKTSSVKDISPNKRWRSYWKINFIKAISSD